MSEILLELFGTGALGTLFGGITGAVSKLGKQWLDLKRAKIDYEFEFKMQTLQNNHDLLMMKANLLEIETQGSYDLLRDTVKAETALHYGVSQKVADARAMFRMRITMFLWWLVALLIPATFYLPMDLLLRENQYLLHIVDAVLFAATSFAGMWSGAKVVTSKHS